MGLAYPTIQYTYYIREAAKRIIFLMAGQGSTGILCSIDDGILCTLPFLPLLLRPRAATEWRGHVFASIDDPMSIVVARAEVNAKNVILRKQTNLNEL